LVAATCPVNNNRYPYVVWENWIEQAQMYPPHPALGLKVPNSQAWVAPGRLLHVSPLTIAREPGLATKVPGREGGADQICNKAGDPPPGQTNLVVCEEVRLNGAAEDYVAGSGLWNRPQQVLAANSGGGIAFSKPSIEVKADWILLSSIGFDCDNLPASLTDGVHVETVNGNCYALAGIAITSKLLKNWLWATWEPQNPVTNPNRCEVLGCTDFYGSRPPRTSGADTELTKRLADLMDTAKLAPEWRNYRLDGVQTVFVGPDRQPTLLGNSIIEAENANIPLTQSSCITCHSVSSIKKDGTDGSTLLTSNPIGKPQALPSNAWSRRDFVWSLSEACPGSPFQSCE